MSGRWEAVADKALTGDRLSRAEALAVLRARTTSCSRCSMRRIESAGRRSAGR